MWPSTQLATLTEVLAFYQVPEDVWQAFIRASGDPGDDLKLLAALPKRMVAINAEAARIGTEPFTTIQASQVGLVYRCAKRMLHLAAGGSVDNWVDPHPWETTAPPVGLLPSALATSTTSGGGGEVRKMKFVNVLDQSDESEFFVLDEATKASFVQRFLEVTGGLPGEEEEPSREQLSALHRKIFTLNSPPYADFSVFTPYGRKTMRASRFRNYVPTGDGMYAVRELPGPSSYVQWLACYRVWRVAMVMLNTISLANLQAYELLMERMHKLYPTAWHLLVQADDKGRSEHLSRLQLQVVIEHQKGGKTPFGRSSTKPSWDPIFRMLIDDGVYWAENVHNPALGSSKGEEGVKDETIEEAEIKKGDEGQTEGGEGGEGGVEKGWIQGPGKFGVLKPSQAKKGEPSQKSYLGGMRNPAASVRSMPGLQNMGARIHRSWERLVKRKPEVLELAANYGTQQCEIKEDLVEEWKRELKQLFNVEAEEVTKLVEKDGYRSEVDPGILEGWTKSSGDPDVAVAKWVRSGAPLGIEEPIECHGIFPPSGEIIPERESEEATTFLTRGEMINYASVEANKDHARELQRYENNGYMRRLTVEEANRAFKKRTLSKLGLILKEREDGSLKKRIVIDLRRSGGNSKAVLPERLLLPRPWDCVLMTREVRANSPKASHFAPEDRWGAEYAVIDITDAFMSFGLHPTEWGHALTPSTQENECLLFVAMLFGYKTAPLVFSRLAAQVARILQAGLDPAIGAHQVYLDDSIFYLQGSLKARDAALSFVLYTMAALGLRVSYKKGKRGAVVQWVGVKFELTQDGNLILGLPTNFLQDTLEVLRKWEKAGYASMKELRAMAGRMSWTAGVLPRARWTVGVLYAVLHQEEEEGKKERKKDKRGLFPVKRLEQARAWLVAFLDVALRKPMRIVALGFDKGPRVVITTDASPEGLGGVLAVNGVIIQAFKSEVTKEDAERHSFTWGSSASQGVVESLSILVALRLWKAKISPGVVELALQSDSITALALTQRLGASTPALNHLGGEIGLVMEELCLEKVKPVHVPGPANGLADFLSRPVKWKKLSLPAGLKDVKIVTAEVRSDGYFQLPLPKNSPTLWGCSEVLPPHTMWDSLQ